MLDSWARQIGIDGKDYEIVIADDGSSDASADCIREWAETSQVRVVLAWQTTNRGPAYARNRALAVARGEILLITGDDIVPPLDFVARHLAWHRAHTEEQSALLGRVVWPDAPTPTPFMRWLETAGHAFYFDFPDVAGEVPPDRFYTCNVSLKRALVSRCGGFREDFPFASHEDLEMGMRLAQTGGMRLHYDPDLKAVHNHLLTPESSVRRVYLNGYSSILYWQRVADDSPRWRCAARRLCRGAAGLVPRKLIWRMASLTPRRGWYAMLALAYWRGAADAVRGDRPFAFS